MSTATPQDVAYISEQLGNAFLGQFSMGIGEQIKFGSACKRVFADDEAMIEVLESLVRRLSKADPVLDLTMRDALGCVASECRDAAGLTPDGE
jgi:hypothetical protein